MKNNEHVYIKKIGDHEGFEVWLVDGSLVRRDLDENFTEYEHHARYKFIPANEIWIEKDTNEEEWKYFLENLDLERKYMEEGLSLEKAAEKANAQEQKDRRHSPRIQKILDSHHKRKEALEKIHKEKLTEWCTEYLTVWRIDGGIVRALYMVDYADGGHDLVYDFVPKNEIWIEEVLDENERKFILLHEMHERYLMSQGKDYHHAHEGATIIEAHYRKNPERLEERMKEELEKNNF
ncbi:MAG: hypothetical protein NTZ13_00895 [Candidatus Parcubacteria bacterium]|nr:hypothetical protein [Candidatus Parcubacteria bacterium]